MPATDQQPFRLAPVLALDLGGTHLRPATADAVDRRPVATRDEQSLHGFLWERTLVLAASGDDVGLVGASALIAPMPLVAHTI